VVLVLTVKDSQEVREEDLIAKAIINTAVVVAVAPEAKEKHTLTIGMNTLHQTVAQVQLLIF
jgi:hypothetical protein